MFQSSKILDYNYLVLKSWSYKLINTGKAHLIQLSFSWNDYPSWPYIQIMMGSGRCFGLIFWLYKFGFDIDLFSHTWNWDYLKEDETEDEL